jgi:predicted Zn-dependent protease
MKKIIGQGLLTIGLFVGSWWALSQIEWVKLLRVAQVTKEAEQKLGQLLVEVFSQEGGEIKNDTVLHTMGSIVNRLCEANGINRSTINVHIVDSEEINAFALPDGHLVVYSGLIADAKNPEELAGVLAHELAHIQLKHVTQKLVKEVGLSALLTLTTGSGNATAIRELARTISGTAFDRSLETEADIVGVSYLQKANMNPTPLADFLIRMTEKQSEVFSYFTWVSTHPDSRDRAEKIKSIARSTTQEYTPSLSKSSWQKLKEIVERVAND